MCQSRRGKVRTLPATSFPGKNPSINTPTLWLRRLQPMALSLAKGGGRHGGPSLPVDTCIGLLERGVAVGWVWGPPMQGVSLDLRSSVHRGLLQSGASEAIVILALHADV